MKTYTFPYAAVFGPGDSCDGEVDVDLTDDEARRLEQSAHAESRWRLNEDEGISDILDKVFNEIYKQEDEDTMIHVNYPTELQF